ncbi:MAG TPA: YciI family protein, partial [Burkholderiales bacterium]|nr:YciI family protein [Burkholderiales bacterium]
MYFALLYEVTDDYLERRAAFRTEHLGLGRAAAERGEPALAGAFSEPADAALLIFEGADASVAEAFAHADPYVAN